MKEPGAAFALLVLLKSAGNIGGDTGIKMTVLRFDNINRPVSFCRQNRERPN